MRIAAASISGSSHSAGRVPRPGIGLPPGGWNMPRISAVALFGTCCRGGAFAIRPSLARRSRRLVVGDADEEAAMRARLDQAAGKQLVVGADDGRRAHRVAARALAHRGQPRPGGEQALAHQLGIAPGELLGEGRVGAARQRHGRLGAAAGAASARRGVSVEPAIQRVEPSAKVYWSCVDRGAYTGENFDCPPPSPSARRRETQGLALGLLGVVIFSMTLPMTRLAVGPAADPQLPPFFVTAGRAACAGLLAAIYLLLVRAPRPGREHRLALAVSALGTVVGFPLLLSLALRRVDAMHAAVDHRRAAAGHRAGRGDRLSPAALGRASGAAPCSAAAW